MHLRGKTKSCGFLGLDELPLQLVLPEYACFHQFSILLRISKGSDRTMCFRKSCNSNFLPGIAETTGVRWRGQGQGEKIYKLIVWICMNYLGSYTGCYTVLLFGRPMWILKTLNFQGLLTSCHPLCSWRHWRPLQTSSSGSWQRRKKKRGKVPLRLHTLHQIIITIIAQTQLHEIQSCLLMQPLLFCLDFVIQDRAGLLPMLFVRPRAHQRLWKNSLRASQATKCPSVVSLDKEHHILVLI